MKTIIEKINDGIFEYKLNNFIIEKIKNGDFDLKILKINPEEFFVAEFKVCVEDFGIKEIPKDFTVDLEIDIIQENYNIFLVYPIKEFDGSNVYFDVYMSDIDNEYLEPEE